MIVFLRISEVTLDTIQDEQIVKDFLDPIRGGICGVMSNTFVKSGTSRHKQYTDANNLNGYALMQKLPYKEFSFVNISLDIVLNTSDDSDSTDKCKEYTRLYQILPLKRKIALGYCDRDTSKSSKLMLDQYYKQEYPIHYRMLKFVGSKVYRVSEVTKVYRIINFKQDYISRNFINLNIEMRANATIEPERCL